jgi:hypothetical protein
MPIIDGGNANDSFTQSVNGGSANSRFNDNLVGGNANYNYATSNADLIFFMNLKLDTTDCWSSFNKKYKYYQFLVQNSQIKSFYRPDNLPEEPIPSDNPILTC